MDNYDIVLDLIEHPERYTAQQMAEILAEPEAREIYNLICKSESSLKANGAVADVDAEWESFTRQNFRPRFRLLRFRSRAASIAVIVLSSVAALAVGLAVTVNLSESGCEPEMAEEINAPSAVLAVADTVAVPDDSIRQSASPVLFENETLAAILDTVAGWHGVTVSYGTPDVAELHLYYRFDPKLPLSEIVEQLNTFEQINIRLDGKTLIVD